MARMQVTLTGEFEMPEGLQPDELSLVVKAVKPSGTKLNVAVFRSEFHEPVEDVWGEDPDYPVEDWRREVENNDTRCGYWEWVRGERARDEEDEEDEGEGGDNED